jgi:hypothetical protein
MNIFVSPKSHERIAGVIFPPKAVQDETGNDEPFLGSPSLSVTQPSLSDMIT